MTYRPYPFDPYVETDPAELYTGDLLSIVPDSPTYDPVASDLMANADEWWKSCAEKAARQLASDGVEFTADDLTEMGVEDPDHPSRWGSLFSALKRDGVITPVGYRPSTRKSRNGGVCRVWIGSKAAA